jgi:NapC/NirT cytochrome c family, N-terminal region
MLRAVTKFIAESCRTLLGLLSVVVVTVCAVAILTIVALHFTGAALSPYAGILAFMVMPAGFVLGLVGVAVARIRMRRAQLRGQPLHPAFDLANPRDRERLVAVGALTAVNLMIMALVSYHGVHFMDSTGFCGKVCHQVMEPEFTAYQNSPHARVECTDCHIGPGASWFVKSKLSGTRQVFAVAFNTYERPIPTPIENLRPARETCEQCHWPAQFHGDRVKVLSRFQDDETNTDLKTVLLLKVGGGSLESAFATGIHWHVASQIDYRAAPDRRTIYWVRVQRQNGATQEFWSQEAKGKRDSILALPMRRMDCIDCHNRPTHAYQRPSDAVDAALLSGKIAQDLPYVHRQAMALLEAEWPSKEVALASFGDSLKAFYQREYPEVATTRAAVIEAAGQAISDIYARNIFPHMHITWGTYPNMIGHRDEGGCFRCHDDNHSTADGETISQDCGTCHNLLAFEEQNPPILQELFGGQ